MMVESDFGEEMSIHGGEQLRHCLLILTDAALMLGLVRKFEVEDPSWPSIKRQCLALQH